MRETRRTLSLDPTLIELEALRAIVRNEESDLDPGVSSSSPYGRLSAAWRLSGFERAILLLAAGPDLVSALAGELEERTGVPHLTFGTALALLPGAHWSAVAPNGPLRRWVLVEPEDATRLTASRLVVDEAVLHALVGWDAGDANLEPYVHDIAKSGPLVGGFVQAAHMLAEAWIAGPVRLDGIAADDARTIAAAAAGDMRVRELFLDSSIDLPAMTKLLQRCARDAVAGLRAIHVDLSGFEPTRAERAAASLSGIPNVVSVGGPDVGRSIEVTPITVEERVTALSEAFGSYGVKSDADSVASTFALHGRQPESVARAAAEGEDPWDAARRITRVDQSLAPRVDARAVDDDLVVPESVHEQLNALIAAVRNRATVLGKWGFAAQRTRGLGTSALFTGPSGTGKTLAAEVIAKALRRDLLRVDLSNVINKYIGETEKNLARLFDAAERSAAVLLFDEADALFGKRTEVRDSHDRYANVEVGYLLQRLEAFTGLVILTSNARSALDPAFVRRLTSIVTFPYPDAAARRRIWERAIPADVPRGRIDLDALAAIDASGGAIASASLVAAYLAADAGERLSTSHLERALAWEAEKSGR